MKVENIVALDFAAQSMRSPIADGGVRQGQNTGTQESRGANAVPSEEDEVKVSPSEILDRIKEISHDGYYSIRFEKNTEFDRIVVKIVDRNTDEVIREVPPEEILRVKSKLTEFSGNIFNNIT